jgi:redox-sensitive bicupin YhaK (pirin superfamily)
MNTSDVRHAEDRLQTKISWLDSKHSFSFGSSYQPGNTHHGLLLVNNDDVVAPGTGFETHPHRDMEIVTWVLDGSLVHQDSEGHNGLIYPGLAQRMSAGTGILHSEKNDAPLAAGSTQRPVHFVQMWVLPDERGIAPGYEQLDVSDALAGGRLVAVASGLAKHRDETAIRINQRDAGLYAARLADGQAIVLPAAPYVHLFLAHGAAALEGAGVLTTGDAVRISDSDGQRLTAVGPAEVLVWEMHSAAAG